MNLVEHTVTEVLCLPYHIYNRWWVDVKGVGYGAESKHNLMFNTKEEALLVTIGYKFNA